MKILTYIHIPKTAGTSIKHSISQEKFFAYSGHNRTPNHNLEHFVVLREPVDRFLSAIWYSYYNDKTWRGADDLIRSGLSTPNDFLDVCFDKTHKLYNLCQIEFSNNNNHYVDGKKISRSWIYEEQILWWNKPKHIILFQNLEEELKKIKLVIPHKNKAIKSPYCLNEEQHKSIKEMYKNDYKLWSYWSEICFKERKNINWDKHKDFLLKIAK